MLAVKEMNKWRSFSRLEVGLSLLGLAAGLGAVGVGYRKKGNASEIISNKGVALIVHDHLGKIAYQRDSRKDPCYENETKLMIASTNVVHHIGLLTPVKIFTYPLEQINIIQGEEFRVIEAKSVLDDAQRIWKKEKIPEDVLNRHCLLLDPNSLENFIKSPEGPNPGKPYGENMRGILLRHLQAIRQLQLDTSGQPNFNLMTAFNSLSQVTAKSNKTKLVGGLFLGSELGASFDMQSTSEEEFIDNVSISSEFGLNKKIALDRILELFREMRDIPLPREFLDAGRDGAFASGLNDVDFETMKKESYVTAIKSLKDAILKYLHGDPNRKRCVGPERLSLASGSEFVRIFFFQADPKLIPDLYRMAEERRKLFQVNQTLAIKGSAFSPNPHRTAVHLMRDNQKVREFLWRCRNLDG